MPIKILTEKVIIDGKQYRSAVSMQGVLSKDELPQRYLDSDLPAFYFNTMFGRSLDSAVRRDTFLFYCNGIPLLRAKVYPENEFQQILSYIRKAGCNLRRIKQELKLQNWKGREEFVI